MSWLAGPISPDRSDDVGPNPAPSPSLEDEEIDLVDRLARTGIADGDDEARGVKEDFEELTQTLTHQFWGIASFLAPPPPGARNLESESNLDLEEEEEDEYEDEDEAKDEDEKDMEEEYEEEEEEDVVGVTEEALAFAENIGHHPETWLDFPLEEEDEEGFQDFHLSDSQYQHALAIQRLVPTLAALRIELCPVHMSEGYFWMVYFVLLHSRLNKNDAEQLSSSELVQARSMWREELQKRAKLHTDWFDRSTFHLQDSTLSPTVVACEKLDPELLEDSNTSHLSFDIFNAGSRPYSELTYNETEKQVVECDTAKSADTSSGHSEAHLLTFQPTQIPQDHDSEDDWVQETAELDGYSTMGIMLNEEDVSFSDLEEDSNWTLPIRSK